jgi:hypothetical protein
LTHIASTPLPFHESFQQRCRSSLGALNTFRLRRGRPEAGLSRKRLERRQPSAIFGRSPLTRSE